MGGSCPGPLRSFSQTLEDARGLPVSCPPSRGPRKQLYSCASSAGPLTPGPLTPGPLAPARSAQGLPPGWDPPLRPKRQGTGPVFAGRCACGVVGLPPAPRLGPKRKIKSGKCVVSLPISVGFPHFLREAPLLTAPEGARGARGILPTPLPSPAHPLPARQPHGCWTGRRACPRVPGRRPCCVRSPGDSNTKTLDACAVLGSRK